MNERTLEVVKAMAGYAGTEMEGYYEETNFTDYLECVFCGNQVLDDEQLTHNEGCPVLAAQQIIAELSNEPQA